MHCCSCRFLSEISVFDHFIHVIEYLGQVLKLAFHSLLGLDQPDNLQQVLLQHKWKAHVLEIKRLQAEILLIF